MTELNRPIIIRIVFVIAFILLLMQTIDYINFTVDDVFIPMRVAENAAAGKGLVYNLGEYVEGYSDPLWVWMLTGAAKLGINRSLSPFALMWFAKGLSYLFGLLSIAVLYSLTKKIFSGSEFKNLFGAFSVLFTAMTAPFIAWCCGGLEMTMVSFFYLCGIYIIYNFFDDIANAESITVSAYIGFSVTFILSSLARPEPVLFAVVSFVTLLILLPGTERKIFIISSVCPYILVMAIFLWWRWNTYHDLLPNSFYAKTGGGIGGYINGAKYFLGAIGNIAAPILFLIPFAFGKEWKKNNFFILINMMLVSAGIFILLSTGDWMPGARFVIPVAPIIFLLGIIGVAQLVNVLQKSGYEISRYSFIVVVILIVFSWTFAGRVTLRGETRSLITGFLSTPGHSLSYHQQTGEWLKMHSKDSEIFAAGEAGIIGYLNPNLYLVDLNGLMDKHIASLRKQGKPFDPEYLLDKKPRYILLYGESQLAELTGHQLSGNYTSMLGINSRFKLEYHLVSTIGYFNIYERN
jgi:arabinofuranosyltransferase